MMFFWCSYALWTHIVAELGEDVYLFSQSFPLFVGEVQSSGYDIQFLLQSAWLCLGCVEITKCCSLKFRKEVVRFVESLSVRYYVEYDDTDTEIVSLKWYWQTQQVRKPESKKTNHSSVRLSNYSRCTVARDLKNTAYWVDTAERFGDDDPMYAITLPPVLGRYTCPCIVIRTLHVQLEAVRTSWGRDIPKMSDVLVPVSFNELVGDSAASRIAKVDLRRVQQDPRRERVQYERHANRSTGLCVYLLLGRFGDLSNTAWFTIKLWAESCSRNSILELDGHSTNIGLLAISACSRDP